MANILEIVVKAKDEASAGLQAVGSEVESMSKQLKVAGAAMTAVGVAGLKMASDARKMNADLGYTATIIGATSEEMRKMALSITDVTFGVRSATATFELLARAGVRDQETMKQNALAFDALADATKSSAEVVADTLIPAYKMFGQELPTTIAEMDKWTYLVTTTNVNLEELGSLMGYIATYGRDLALSSEDVVVMMKAMAEQGRDASDAARLLRTGINQAEGSLEKLYNVLGITQDEIGRYSNELRNATGITQDLQSQQASQYTVLDKLKQKWQELELSLAPVLQALEPIFSVMSALGPALLAAVYVVPKLVAAFRALRVSMTAAKLEAIAMWGAITMGVSLAVTGIIELVRWLNRGEEATDEFDKAVQDLAITMQSDVETAARRQLTNIEMTARADVQSINERRNAWRSFHVERMSQITAELMADLQAILPEDVYQSIQGMIERWNELQGGIEETTRTIDELTLIDLRKQILDPNLTAMQRAQIQSQINQLEVTQLEDAIFDALNEIAPAIADQLEAAESPASAYYDKLVEGVTEAAEEASTAWTDVWNTNFAASMDGTYQGAVETGQRIAAWFRTNLPEELIPTYKYPETYLYPRLSGKYGPPEEERLGWYRRFQSGGIVTRPISALIGEAGPEAVIPLSGAALRGEIHNHYQIGYLLGDETSLRRFARQITQIQGEESRRNQFGQIQSGYYYGRSSV